MTPIDNLLSQLPRFVVIVLSLAAAWKHHLIPGFFKMAKGAAAWMSSKLWTAIFEPKYQLAHRYHLKRIFTRPMCDLGSSVKYRLITPSILRPEIHDPIFGRDISGAALLSVVAGPTVERIELVIEVTFGLNVLRTLSS